VKGPIEQSGATATYQRLCLALILAGLTAALVWEAWVTGVIVDGPAHLLSANLYWSGADRLQPGDVPPLMKIMGGWVSRFFFNLPVPYDHEVWRTQQEWWIAGEMMQRMNADQIQRLFFFSRLPLLVFPLLTTLLVWHWGRQLFGGWTGVLLALAMALEPTALGHGAPFKNDLAATFTHLLFWYRAWRFWKDARWRNAAWLGAALLVALLAKMSLLYLLAAAPLVVALRYATLPGPRLRRAAVGLLLVLLIPYLGVVAAYHFEARRLPATELAAHRADPVLPGWFVWPAHIFAILPVPPTLWKGAVSLFHSNAVVNTIYMLGKIYPDGHPLYFVVALALKVPIPVQILVLCGAGMAAWRWRRRQLEAGDVFWLLPPVLYVGLASLSTLQLGVRLVLPALPFGLLWCGLPVAAWIRDRRIALVAGLFTWLAIRSLEVYPHGISYFNSWIGGPEHGIDYLADSNVDWGQDLSALAEYIERYNIPKIHVSYFGTNTVVGYFDEQRVDIVVPPWGPEYAKGAVYQPEPGFYAISANLIPGHAFNNPATSMHTGLS